MSEKVKRIKIGKTILDYSDIVPITEVFALNVYHTEMIRDGDTVLDLGAGIGDFTVRASELVGEYGKVISVEPNPADFELLLRNIKNNSCKNVVPLNYGVADKSGILTITFKDETFDFKAMTLKEILVEANSDHADFVKIDIEGYEMQVLRFSLQELRRTRVIAAELHGDLAQLDKILLKSGYKVDLVNQTYLRKSLFKFLVKHPIVSGHLYLSLKDNLHIDPVRRFHDGLLINRAPNELAIRIYSKANVVKDISADSLHT